MPVYFTDKYQDVHPFEAIHMYGGNLPSIPVELGTYVLLRHVSKRNFRVAYIGKTDSAGAKARAHDLVH